MPYHFSDKLIFKYWQVFLHISYEGLVILCNPSAFQEIDTAAAIN